MTPEEFRKAGHQAVDWIADYLARVDTLPVQPNVEPDWVRSQLPDGPPREGDTFEDVLADLDKVILPALLHWQSPHFFGYYPANTSGPSILGELISAGLGVQGMLWATSPACTELESHVLDWLVDLLGLPEHFKTRTRGGGVIQDTASSATLCALLAARERCLSTGQGLQNHTSRLTAYASEQAHSSVEKAMMIAGLGANHLRRIPTDEAYRMSPSALRQAIAEDVAEGFQPCFVCATLGTTSTASLDPVPEIGAICRDHGVWLHVDAAYAGSAAICPEFRSLHDGVELADSYCFNPHKWMFVNFDCDCFYVVNREHLLRALSILPEYLRNQATESGKVIDYRDWQVPLGRRFRALKLWFVLRSFGTEAIQQKIRDHVEWAARFAELVEASPHLQLAAPQELGLVCFSHSAGDQASETLLQRLNSSGRLFLTHTKLNDRFVLRLSIGQTQTEWKHVRDAWEQIEDVALQLAESGG